MPDPPRLTAGTIAQTVRNRHEPDWLRLITQRERRIAMVLSDHGETAVGLSTIRDIISRLAPTVERNGVESFAQGSLMRALAEAMGEPR